ncbi:hypothetical protein STEG23_028639 [Scotinomys teguina]
MTVMPLGRDQDYSLKNREPDGPAPWFLDPGGWSKTTAVRLFFIFPGICTLSLISGDWHTIAIAVTEIDMITDDGMLKLFFRHLECIEGCHGGIILTFYGE